MAGIYYKFPLQLAKVLNGQELPTCDMAESIKSNLELIIITRFGEHRGDEGFGCEIWDLDFELIVSEGLWEEKLRQSLVRSITSHEKRLSEIQIDVKISEVERFHHVKQMTEVKKKVNITLGATIHKTGEPFHFNTSLFLSPLAVD